MCYSRYLAWSSQDEPALLNDISEFFHGVWWEVRHNWDIHEVVVTAKINPNERSLEVAAMLHSIDEQFFLIFGPDGAEPGRDKRTGLVMVAACANGEVRFEGTEVCVRF